METAADGRAILAVEFLEDALWHLGLFRLRMEFPLLFFFGFPLALACFGLYCVALALFLLVWIGFA